MAASFFKTLWIPNADGTDSTSPCNNSNTAFVHSYLGDDLTGDGTRENPYRTVNKARQKSGISYIVFRGIINEYISGGRLIGDDINQIVVHNYYYVGSICTRVTFDFFKNTNFWDTASYNVIVLYSNSSRNSNQNYNSYCLFQDMSTEGYNDGYVVNCTIKDSDLRTSVNNTSKNNLIYNSTNVSSSGIVYKNFVFLSSCIFKYNGTVVPSPTWTNDPKGNINLLRTAYVKAGMSQINADALFYKDVFGNETCQIVWEKRNGGILPNIFNKYNVDGTIADFTLNPDPHNVALWASDIGGYVGCFKPAETISMADPIINVNSDGTDDIIAGTLLQYSGDNLVFNNLSTQTWNRMRSANVTFIPNGSKFKGSGSMSKDGSPFGTYIGKYQYLIDTIQINPGDTLTVGSLYKVFNDTSNNIDNAILYNNVQYLPEYTFQCIAGVTIFSLLNSGSGTYVKRIIADPMESIEIFPYDNPTTQSAFPPFSVPLMGEVKILFYTAAGAKRYGKTTGAPVLFGDLVNVNFGVDFSTLVNNKIAYYNNYAISNADQEYVVLSSNTNYFIVAIPTLNYFKTEINAHNDNIYDY
jgi:hypothetical protein